MFVFFCVNSCVQQFGGLDGRVQSVLVLGGAAAGSVWLCDLAVFCVVGSVLRVVWRGV